MPSLHSSSLCPAVPVQCSLYCFTPTGPPSSPRGKELEAQDKPTEARPTPTISQGLLYPDSATGGISASPPKGGRQFRITSVGSSDLSACEQSISTVIQIDVTEPKETAETDRTEPGNECESSVKAEEELEGEGEGEGGLMPEPERLRVMGASVPLPIPTSRHHHELAHERAQRGISAEPHINYTSFHDEVPKTMRKTISGALHV